MNIFYFFPENIYIYICIIYIYMYIYVKEATEMTEIFEKQNICFK